jgi:signal peptidase I
VRRALREIALTVGAAAGLLGIALTVASFVFGLRPLAVTSGSMAPAIDTGSLAWVRSVGADELRIGDVVTVAGADGNAVTHRVESIAGTGDERVLTLRGDANDSVDAQLYVVTEADRVVASLGLAGYALVWLGHPGGVVVVVGAIFAVLAAAFRAGVRHGPPRAAGAGRRGSLAAAVVGVVLVSSTIALGVSTVRSSPAAWTDEGVASTGPFGAHTVQLPSAAPTCTNVGGVIGLLGYAQLSWPHRDTRYAYSYTVTRVDNGLTVATGTRSTAGAVNSAVTLDIQTALLGGGLGSNVNLDVAIRSILSASPTWTSASAWTTRVHTVNIALVGLSVRCGPVP